MKVVFILLIIFILATFYQVENFLVDKMISVLENNPPCLLNNNFKKMLSNKEIDYCGILSKKVCDKCKEDCVWVKNKCVKRKSYSNIGPIPGCMMTNYCDEKNNSECKEDYDYPNWDITESKCYTCQNCGWCIDKDWNGTCQPSDCNNPDCRPNDCVQGWEYQCVDYGKI